MSHATLPITTFLRPTHRAATVIAVLALVAILAIVLVRTIDGDEPKPVPAASKAVPSQGPSPVSGTRPDGGPDESRVAVAISRR